MGDEPAEPASGPPDTPKTSAARTPPTSAAGAYRLGRVADLKRGTGMSVRVGRLELGVWRSADGQVHVLDNTCLHVGGPLSEGFLVDGCVVCPWHGWTYELETGRRRTADGTSAGVRSYHAWVDGDEVWVELPGDGPT